jgi:hypothetical protein
VERAFWLAIRRAAKTYLAALDGTPGAQSPHLAGKDALRQVIAAIERRFEITPRD